MEKKFNESVSMVVDEFLRFRLTMNQKAINSRATKEFLWKNYKYLLSSKNYYERKMFEGDFDLDVFNLVRKDFLNYLHCDISESMLSYFVIENEISEDIFSNAVLNLDEINNLLYYVKKAILNGGLKDKPFILNEGEFIKKLLIYLIEEKNLTSIEEEQVKDWLKFFEVSQVSFFYKETMSKLILESDGRFGIYTKDDELLSLVNNEGNINLYYQAKYDRWHNIDDLYYGYIGTKEKRILWILKKIKDDYFITDYFNLTRNNPYLKQEDVIEMYVVDSLYNFFMESNLLEFKQEIYNDKDLEKIRSILNFALGDLEFPKEKVLYFYNDKLKS